MTNQQKLENAAKDFSNRFEGVMKELAEEDTMRGRFYKTFPVITTNYREFDMLLDWCQSEINRAVEKERERIKKNLIEYKEKGFEFETAIYSACVPELSDITKPEV